jgi:hypothetical protein
MAILLLDAIEIEGKEITADDLLRNYDEDCRCHLFP